MGIKVKITKNDSSQSAKIILFDNKNKVLFLKRSRNLNKYPDSWDLPGGHIKEGESLLQGLKREVLEETSIKIEDAVFFRKEKNISFFWAKYDFQEEITLSHEHKSYSFFSKKQLTKSDKFQKIALEILEKIKNA